MTHREDPDPYSKEQTLVPLDEVGPRITELVDATDRDGQRFAITRNGERVAVLIAAAEYDSRVETLDLLSDPETMHRYSEGPQALQEGELLTLDEVRRTLRDAGRLPNDQ